MRIERLTQYYKAKGMDANVDKKDPIVLKLKEWVDEQYKNGRTTAISDKELEKNVITKQHQES